jgi:hypothetical protein
LDILSGVAYNQPTLCPNASWNPDATTLANSTIIGSYPAHVIVTRQDTVLVLNPSSGSIFVWRNNSANVTITISTGSWYRSVMAIAGDNTIWVQKTNCTSSYFSRWSINGTLINTKEVPYLKGEFTERSVDEFTEIEVTSEDCIIPVANVEYRLFESRIVYTEEIERTVARCLSLVIL